MDKVDWQKKGEGHRQRLRDKFLERGLDGFPDDEVIELLLTLGTPRKDCKELARTVLERFGSLAAALEASPAELQQIKGLGPKNGFALNFIQAVASHDKSRSYCQRKYGPPQLSRLGGHHAVRRLV